MKKIWTGILIGILVLLGVTVFVQRKKIFNLSDEDYDDCDCECGDGCCCDEECEEEKTPEKQVENTVA